MQASELTVIAGFRRANDNSSSSLTERNVVSIIPHNKFTKTVFDSDIAVLKVDLMHFCWNPIQIFFSLRIV